MHGPRAKNGFHVLKGWEKNPNQEYAAEALCGLQSLKCLLFSSLENSLLTPDRDNQKLIQQICFECLLTIYQTQC